MIGTRSKTEIVLRALMRGISIKLQDCEYVIKDGRFGLMGYHVSGEQTRRVFLGIDWSLNSFIAWCDAMPDERINEIAVDLAFTDHRRKR